jgi:hypothetical protein
LLFPAKDLISDEFKKARPQQAITRFAFSDFAADAGQARA